MKFLLTLLVALATLCLAAPAAEGPRPCYPFCTGKKTPPPHAEVDAREVSSQNADVVARAPEPENYRPCYPFCTGKKKPPTKPLKLEDQGPIYPGPVTHHNRRDLDQGDDDSDFPSTATTTCKKNPIMQWCIKQRDQFGCAKEMSFCRGVTDHRKLITCLSKGGCKRDLGEQDDDADVPAEANANADSTPIPPSWLYSKPKTTPIPPSWLYPGNRVLPAFLHHDARDLDAAVRPTPSIHGPVTNHHGLPLHKPTRFSDGPIPPMWPHHPPQAGGDPGAAEILARQNKLRVTVPMYKWGAPHENGRHKAKCAKGVCHNARDEIFDEGELMDLHLPIEYRDEEAAEARAVPVENLENWIEVVDDEAEDAYPTPTHVDARDPNKAPDDSPSNHHADHKRPWFKPDKYTNSPSNHYAKPPS